MKKNMDKSDEKKASENLFPTLFKSFWFLNHLHIRFSRLNLAYNIKFQNCFCQLLL